MKRMSFSLSSSTRAMSRGRGGRGLCEPLPPRVPSRVHWKCEQQSFSPVPPSALGSCVVRGNAIDFELVSKFRFQRDIE